jgi:hypothetical protein
MTLAIGRVFLVNFMSKTENIRHYTTFLRNFMRKVLLIFLVCKRLKYFFRIFNLHYSVERHAIG